MINVMTYPSDKGLRLHVRGFCTGLSHMGDLCESRAVTSTIPSSRIESLGFPIALEESLQDIWVEFPGILEMLLH